MQVIDGECRASSRTPLAQPRIAKLAIQVPRFAILGRSRRSRGLLEQNKADTSRVLSGGLPGASHVAERSSSSGLTTMTAAAAALVSWPQPTPPPPRPGALARMGWPWIHQGADRHTLAKAGHADPIGRCLRQSLTTSDRRAQSAHHQPPSAGCMQQMLRERAGCSACFAAAGGALLLRL